MVLFEKIGPGAHECNWCGCRVTWMPRSGAVKGSLISDHVDGDTLNNSPINLVASCHGCNSSRQRDRSRIVPGEITITNKNGTVSRAIRVKCSECPTVFLSRFDHSGLPYKKYCSRPCQSTGVSRSLTGVKKPHNWTGRIFIRKGLQNCAATVRQCRNCSRDIFVASCDDKKRGKFCSRKCVGKYKTKVALGISCARPVTLGG